MEVVKVKVAGEVVGKATGAVVAAAEVSAAAISVGEGRALLEALYRSALSVSTDRGRVRDWPISPDVPAVAPILAAAAASGDCGPINGRRRSPRAAAAAAFFPAPYHDALSPPQRHLGAGASGPPAPPPAQYPPSRETPPRTNLRNRRPLAPPPRWRCMLTPPRGPDPDAALRARRPARGGPDLWHCRQRRRG
jgi:hypothetical protein